MNSPVGNKQVALSIVIPAYNEEKRLPLSMDRVVSFAEKRGGPTEIIVVNDGSRDDTANVVRRYMGGALNVRLLENPGNRGKGYAVRHGALRASHDWVLITDADLSTPIEDVEKLITATRVHNADVAFGSRALDRKLVAVHQSAAREISGRVFNLAVRMMTQLPYSDTQCGFKLYSREAAQLIFSMQRLDGFGFDVEDLYIAKRLGFRAKEVPVRWANVEGSKVSLMSGMKAFVEVAYVRWSALTGHYADADVPVYRNPSPAKRLQRRTQ